MPLTTTQKATLKAFVLAEPAYAAQIALQDWPGINDSLSATAAPDFMVWNTRTTVDSVLDQIDQTKYTPADTPDLTSAPLYTARAQSILIKQMNLQNLILGRFTIDASKAIIRANLRDSVIALPAGAAGASVSAGGASGVNALTACLRKANLLEKVLTTGNATTGTVTGALMGYEGVLDSLEFQLIMTT